MPVRKFSILCVSIAAGLTLVACAAPPAASPRSSSTAVSTQSSPTTAPTAEATTAATEEVTATTEATETYTEAVTTTAEATTSASKAVTPTESMTTTGAMTPTVEATLSVSTSKLGEILTGEAGRTVYVFTKDTNGTSVCYDSCAQNWPAVMTMGAPKGGTGIDASLLGTTTRKDGSLQVTYNGMPLYYYAKDTAAGDVNGQDVGSVWYVIAPNGKMIEQ